MVRTGNGRPFVGGAETPEGPDDALAPIYDTISANRAASRGAAAS